LRAQRGLRDVARLGGEAEVAVALEGDDVGELEQGHGLTDKRKLSEDTNKRLDTSRNRADTSGESGSRAGSAVTPGARRPSLLPLRGAGASVRPPSTGGCG